MPAETPYRTGSHNIDVQSLDEHALDVIQTLNEAGFDAYLVGGCVRDALCGVEPKDFDVATNAKPEEVKSLFRRARLVGRRFPIAHVRYGRNLIEVSTFRQGQMDHDDLETNEQGMIVKDQAFGTMSDDAFRRDFTVNALYYDVTSNEIIDYVGGIEDIQNKTLRFIGETHTRIAEDPVRLLRAIRFGAKLGFTVDPQILQDMDDTAERLEAIPKARLFDEFLKLFLTGYGAEVWTAIRDTPLVRSLFPSCNPASELVLAAMQNTDRRIADDQPVTPGFLVAVLLWDDFQAKVAEHNPQKKPDLMYDIAMDTFAVQQQHITLPRRFTQFAREVWQLQNRLESRQPRHIQRILGHKRFRAGFDFLVLRGHFDNKLKKLGNWWEEIQFAEKPRQEKMISELPAGNRRRRRRKKNNQTPNYNTQYHSESSGNTFGDRNNQGGQGRRDGNFDSYGNYSPMSNNPGFDEY